MKKRLEFRGGMPAAFVPVIIFLVFCVLYLTIFKAFEMYALTMGAFVGLLVGSLFVTRTSYESYWESIYDGIREAIPLVVLLLVIGLFSAMIKTSNISAGFVWMANSMGLSGGVFTAFTFLAVCVISTATGSSIGSLFTCFPIFYPAGLLLGSNPAILAGALVSGAVFGDNLAPVSDTTIISAATQEYTQKEGVADIGGCVASRLKYSLVAGAISLGLFVVFGGGGTTGEGAQTILASHMDPTTLWMLIPVVIMLIIALVTHNIYQAITGGIILGLFVGLISGILTPSSIIGVQDGVPTGFLTDGIQSMMATVCLVISVYGIMGVLTGAGALDRITDAVLRSRLGRTVQGTEIAMMLGISVTTLLFGGVTSASMATFGKVQNELGKRVKLHPYRRANLLDGFANALVVAVPFLSVFVFLGALLSKGYSFAAPLTLTQVSSGMFYSITLFFVLLFSIMTGWGRQFEGPDGEPVDEIPRDPSID